MQGGVDSAFGRGCVKTQISRLRREHFPSDALLADFNRNAVSTLCPWENVVPGMELPNRVFTQPRPISAVPHELLTLVARSLSGHSGIFDRRNKAHRLFRKQQLHRIPAPHARTLAAGRKRRQRRADADRHGGEFRFSDGWGADFVHRVTA